MWVRYVCVYSGQKKNSEFGSLMTSVKKFLRDTAGKLTEVLHLLLLVCVCQAKMVFIRSKCTQSLCTVGLTAQGVYVLYYSLCKQGQCKIINILTAFKRCGLNIQPSKMFQPAGYFRQYPCFSKLH